MLQELLNKHCMDPKNPNKIFDLAKEYDRLEQGAMAVSLYLKAADLTEDKLLQYKCMIGIGNCYWRQGNRTYTVEGAFQDAAALIPERPEAHYFLAGLCAERQLWKASYLHAKLARLFNVNDDIDVGYKGRKASAVQEAIAKWYITGTQEGKHALFDLKFKSKGSVCCFEGPGGRFSNRTPDQRWRWCWHRCDTSGSVHQREGTSRSCIPLPMPCPSGRRG